VAQAAINRLEAALQEAAATQTAPGIVAGLWSDLAYCFALTGHLSECDRAVRQSLRNGPDPAADAAVGERLVDIGTQLWEDGLGQPAIATTDCGIRLLGASRADRAVLANARFTYGSMLVESGHLSDGLPQLAQGFAEAPDGTDLDAWARAGHRVVLMLMNQADWVHAYEMSSDIVRRIAEAGDIEVADRATYRDALIDRLLAAASLDRAAELAERLESALAWAVGGIGDDPLSVVDFLALYEWDVVLADMSARPASKRDIWWDRARASAGTPWLMDAFERAGMARPPGQAPQEA